MSDPVTAFFVLTLVFGLGAVVGLMARDRDTYQPPAPLLPPYPLTHVRPRQAGRSGDCAVCGKKDVPVQPYADSPVLDPIDTCNGCLRSLVDEPVGGGA